MKKVLFLFLVLNTIDFSLSAQTECIRPLNFPFERIFLQRNDTAFTVYIYSSKEKIDSIVYDDIAVKIANKRWKIDTISDGSYSIVKYRKVKRSQWFKENNGKLFQVDGEYIEKRYWRYYPDGSMDVYWRFGCIAHLKHKKDCQNSLFNKSRKYE